MDRIRKLKLTGGREGKTVTLNHIQFMDGVATLKMNDKDWLGIKSYFEKCYACKEVIVDGDDETGEDRPQEVGGKVQEEGRAPEAPTDVGEADAETEASEEELPTSGDGPFRPDAARIKEIVESLDLADDENWTDGGLPRVDVVAGLYGEINVTRADVERAMPGFKRCG